MKGLPLDIWELIAIAQDTYRGTLYLCLAGIPRLGEESRLKRIRKALTREGKTWAGSKYWTLDGHLHREDNLPVLIDSFGIEHWYINEWECN